MRSLLPVLIAAALVAALPASAPAKGITSAEVCGAAGCRDVDEASFYALFAEGEPTDPPAAAAPFVTVKLTIAHGPDAGEANDGFDYVPTLGITRPRFSTSNADWVKLSATSRMALDDVVRGVPPLSAARLTGVPQPVAPTGDGGPPWWAIAGAALAGLVALALLARYATSALNARPRASKSAN
jgi:hypothetical protein